MQNLVLEYFFSQNHASLGILTKFTPHITQLCNCLNNIMLYLWVNKLINMKRTIQTSKVIFLSALFSLIGLCGTFAQQNITSVVKNLHFESDKEIQFELWLENTSNTKDVLKLSGFQAGLAFDYELLSNGGTIQTSIVNKNKALEGLMNKVEVKNHTFVKTSSKNTTNEKGIWRMPVLPIKNVSTAPVISKEGLYLGAYSITNTKAFNTSALNTIAWQLENNEALTRTAVLAFENNEKVGTSYTNPAKNGRLLNTRIVFGQNKGISNTDILGGEFNLYPNPAYNNINVTLIASEAQNTTMKILDVNGKVVKEQAVSLIEGKSSQTLSVSNLAAGNYTLQVLVGEKLLSAKFAKK